MPAPVPAPVPVPGLEEVERGGLWLTPAPDAPGPGPGPGSRSDPELISADTLFRRRANVTFFSSLCGGSEPAGDEHSCQGLGHRPTPQPSRPSAEPRN